MNSGSKARFKRCYDSTMASEGLVAEESSGRAALRRSHRCPVLEGLEAQDRPLELRGHEHRIRSADTRHAGL